MERVFWRTFGPKREEVMDGSWRTMHSDELHDLYSSLIKPYQIMVDAWRPHRRSEISRVFVLKTLRVSPLGRLYQVVKIC